MMNASLWIDFWLVRSWGVGELGAGQDVEIIVGCVAAGVTFGPNCSTWVHVNNTLSRSKESRLTKDDEIFSNTCAISQHVILT